MNALFPDPYGQGQWVLLPNAPALPAPPAVPALPPPPTQTRLAFLPGNQANGAMVEGTFLINSRLARILFVTGA